MYEQCNGCMCVDVCMYKDHYEDAVKTYLSVKEECQKYPWFICNIECVKYRRRYEEVLNDVIDDICKKLDENIDNFVGEYCDGIQGAIDIIKDYKKEINKGE